MQKRSRQAFEADLQSKESPYVVFGTPLPPLDDRTRDDGSFVPVWQQEVTDERGRKRLHGAFTGGWSAGYFNTVGSKEGWTPATFVSSRKNRVGDGKQQGSRTVEDYMDEDDIREADEARTLQVASGFDGFGTEHDPVRNAGIMDLFHPTRSGIGQQLLHRMGWRDGQGIGPMIKRTAKLDQNEAEPSETEQEEHLFAPDDVQMIGFSHKTDYKGIGYEAELSQAESTVKHSRDRGNLEHKQEDDRDTGFGRPSFQLTSPTSQRDDLRKHPKRKGGIGVGVLNDSGSDEDDDPYSMGPRIALNKTLGDVKKKSKRMAGGLSTNPSLKSKPVYVTKALPSLKNVLRKCHDGRLPLDGFVFGKELDAFGAMSLNDDKYKPPEVPGGWTPSRTKNADTSVGADYVSTKDTARASNLDAKARAGLLQEKTLPGKSVFDFLSPAAREKLARVSGNSNLPPAKGEASKANYEERQDFQGVSDVPSLDRTIAQTALQRKAGGWMPYGEDHQKRERYFAFLESQATNGDGTPPGISIIPPKGVSRSDWIIELHEFVRAAQVFQPISGSMASRFTSSASLPQGSSGSNDQGEEDSLIRTVVAKPEDPAVAAAKAGMFGPMTRSLAFFYPTKLLCKRFGVPLPDLSAAPQPHSATEAASRPVKNVYSDYTSRFQSAGVFKNGETSSVDPSTTAEVSVGASGAQPVNTPITDAASNTAIEQQRPDIEVFKAIFEDDGKDRT